MIKNIISYLVVFLVGDHILDEMMKDKEIKMSPYPFRSLRDKLLHNLNKRNKS